jgi:AcrR family transcriptional regulator
MCDDVGSMKNTQPARRIRRDTARTRDRLLDAAGVLLGERGPTFSLPDLARASGVATATVYRHFGDVHDVHRAFYQRLIDELVTELNSVADDARGLRRFERVNDQWVELAAGWGRAATHIRSAAGFLERVHAGDPLTSALYAALAPVVAELVEEGVVPPQEVDFAVLLWVTLFDERVIVDLTSSLGWSSRRIARRLSSSLLDALSEVVRAAPGSG